MKRGGVITYTRDQLLSVRGSSECDLPMEFLFSDAGCVWRTLEGERVFTPTLKRARTPLYQRGLYEGGRNKNAARASGSRSSARDCGREWRKNAPTRTPPAVPTRASAPKHTLTPTSVVKENRWISGTKKGKASSKENEGALTQHQRAQREKQISYGMATLGYKWGGANVHITTPDPAVFTTKRAWDSTLRVWRKQLHDYDPRTAEEHADAKRRFPAEYAEWETSAYNTLQI